MKENGAFSEFLASFSAPHQLDNRMSSLSALSFSGFGTAVFLSDAGKLNRPRGEDEYILRSILPQPYSIFSFVAGLAHLNATDWQCSELRFA